MSVNRQRWKPARQLIVKVCFVHIHFLQAIQPFFSLHKRSRAVKNLFTSISMSMLLTSEVEASSLSGRALLLQQGQGHPLSPLLNPSLLLRSQPTSRNASCECNKGKMRWIEQSLNQFDIPFHVGSAYISKLNFTMLPRRNHHHKYPISGFL